MDELTDFVQTALELFTVVLFDVGNAAGGRADYNFVFAQELTHTLFQTGGLCLVAGIPLWLSATGLAVRDDYLAAEIFQKAPAVLYDFGVRCSDVAGLEKRNFNFHILISNF